MRKFSRSVASLAIFIACQTYLRIAKAEGIDSAPLKYRCTLSVDGQVKLNTLCAAVSSDSDIEWNDKKMEFSCNGRPGMGNCIMAAMKITRHGNFGFLFNDGDGYTRLNWNQGKSTHAENGFNDLKKVGSDCWASNKATWMYGNDKKHKVKFCIIGWQ